jgi:hypothetical protein
MTALRHYSAWAWLLILLLVVAVLSVMSSTSGTPDVPLALDNPAPDGALALDLWLSRIGYSINRQTSYGTPSGTGTLLILEPLREPSPAEVTALRRWVGTGGRLVVVSDGTAKLLRAFGFDPVGASPAQVQVNQPLLVSPPTAHLAGKASVVSRRAADGGAVAATPSGAVLTWNVRGLGEVWELSAAPLLDNRHIARGQNRRLALNLAGPPGPLLVDQPSPITPSSGSSNWLTGTAWGIAVIFGLAVLVLFRWLGGWRLGPPLVPFSERRRPAVEYVLSLAVLLRQAHQRSDVLTIYQRELRDRLRSRFGTDQPDELPGDLADTVRPLLQPHADLTEEALIREAEAIVRCEEALKERV